jgi:thiopeptide-type bacteriocin biosynthesis protein
VSAKLYCQPQDLHALLIDHLPTLVADLPRSIWWISSRDTEAPPHTSLTVRLADPSHAGDAVTTLGAWAAHLLDTGVMNDVVLAPYRPHTGLWGTRRTLKAAEEVWATDSAVVAYQHSHLHTLAPEPVLAAANIVAIVTGLHQNTEAGMRWLSAQPKPPTTGRLSPALLKQARTIADPDDDWSGLRRTPAGADLVEGPWSARHTALGEHRAVLAGVRHPNVDTVLHALLAAHLRLVREPADGIAWRLARAVALAATRPRSKPMP